MVLSETKLPSDATTSASKTALIYLRVSTSKQSTRNGEIEGYSIPAQRRACTRKVEELGAHCVEEFVDAGASARSADRPGLQALLEQVRDGGVDYVVVHKLDRLARDRADDVSIALAIRSAGAILVSASEQIDETPAGMLLHGIMATIAEFYSRNLSSEAKKGIAQKAQRGGTHGVAPLGYFNTLARVAGREVKGVIIDEERAVHIRWAFEAYATGDWSISELRDELERRGLRSRTTRAFAGSPLNNAQVHKMLNHPYYIGKVTHRGVISSRSRCGGWCSRRSGLVGMPVTRRGVTTTTSRAQDCAADAVEAGWGTGTRRERAERTPTSSAWEGTPGALRATCPTSGGQGRSARRRSLEIPGSSQPSHAARRGT